MTRDTIDSRSTVIEESLQSLAARLDSHEEKLLHLAQAYAELVRENEGLKRRLEQLE